MPTPGVKTLWEWECGWVAIKVFKSLDGVTWIEFGLILWVPWGSWRIESDD